MTHFRFIKLILLSTALAITLSIPAHAKLGPTTSPIGVPTGGSDTLRSKVAEAKLNLAGFRISNTSSARPVDESLRGPVHGPNASDADGDFAHIYDRYQWWFLALIFGFALMVLSLVYIVRLNKKLMLSNQRLRAEVNKREAVESVLRKSEFRLEEALDKAKAANEVKNQFLANMNHEIRTPMNGVIGMTSLLLSTPMTEEQRDYTNTVKASAHSLLRIIDDILDYSKIENDKIDLEVIDFELPAIIEDVAVAVSAKAEEKKLEFTYVLDPDVPTHFSGDANRLIQIIHHLISNALKFTSRGDVFLHIALQEEDPQHAMVRFSIRDTGIGIDPDRVDRLFTSFNQADISHTRKYGGTGLGLTISKHIIQMMGGDIGVDSAPSKGSTFWFTVRLKKQQSISKRAPFVSHDFSDKRILIVDDNATNRQVLKGYLNSWGMRFACADGAPTALAMLHKAAKATDPFHLAIVDHLMPSMNGEDLGRAIQADPSLGDLKMVLLTSGGDHQEAQRSKAAGFCAYMTKPIYMDDCFRCLSLIFGKPPVQQSQSSIRDPLITKQTATAAEQHGPRILIVEDNTINQKVAKKILNKHGCRVQIAANGREAVEALQRSTYDVVLMDLQMPEMDGHEATVAIRDPANKCLDPNIPIIALTANAQQDVRETCFKVGMNDYLAKPADPEVLIEKIRHWIDRGRANRSLISLYSN